MPGGVLSRSNSIISLASYYHEDRTQIGLNKQTLAARLVESHPIAENKVLALPRMGGLHHRYTLVGSSVKANRFEPVGHAVT